MLIGDPRGIRTPVTGVRGQRPRPLDDGTTYKLCAVHYRTTWNLSMYYIWLIIIEIVQFTKQLIMDGVSQVSFKC